MRERLRAYGKQVAFGLGICARLLLVAGLVTLGSGLALGIDPSDVPLGLLPPVVGLAVLAAAFVAMPSLAGERHLTGPWPWRFSALGVVFIVGLKLMDEGLMPPLVRFDGPARADYLWLLPGVALAQFVAGGLALRSIRR